MVNKLDLIGKDTRRWKSSPSPTRSRRSSARPRPTKTTKAKGQFTIGEPKPKARRQGRPDRVRSSRSARSSAPSTPSSSEVRQPPPLGRLGQRHRQDRPHPHRPHHAASWRTRDEHQQEADRPSTALSPPGAPRRPERQHHRRRDHRDAGPAPHHQAGVRRPVRATTASPVTTPCHKAMQGVLDVLQEHHLEKEADTLQALLRQREDARRRHRQRRRASRRSWSSCTTSSSATPSRA